MLNGLVYPIFSIFLSQIIQAFFDLQSKDITIVEDGRRRANLMSLGFLLLAIMSFIVTFTRDMQTFMVGDEITTNMRRDAYKKILTMPVSWFDNTDNNVGVLSTRLGTDCQTINGMATTYIYLIIQSLTTLVAALIIAFIYDWRTSLVAVAMLPIVMLSGFVRSKFRSGQM